MSKCRQCGKLHILKRNLCDVCYVAELEAKLDVFDEMDEMLRICLKANVSMAEKLDRVRGLPEKWREDEDACAAWEQWRSGEHCADELQSALGDEE